MSSHIKYECMFYFLRNFTMDKKLSLRAKIQSFGGFLTAMVIPNIGAFMAWGFITALFIPAGWLPNEQLGSLVSPMITYMLPMLVGYTGGDMVGGKRGAIIGTVGTMGIVVEIGRASCRERV